VQTDSVILIPWSSNPWESTWERYVRGSGYIRVSFLPRCHIHMCRRSLINYVFPRILWSLNGHCRRGIEADDLGNHHALRNRTVLCLLGGSQKMLPARPLLTTNISGPDNNGSGRSTICHSAHERRAAATPILQFRSVFQFFILPLVLLAECPSSDLPARHISCDVTFAGGEELFASGIGVFLARTSFLLPSFFPLFFLSFFLSFTLPFFLSFFLYSPFSTSSCLLMT
jgi:hypothetical protein